MRRFLAPRLWKAAVQGAGKPPEPAGWKACPTVVDLVTSLTFATGEQFLQKALISGASLLKV
ncbi:MAG: hypothetical protein C5B50_18670, partial [Verrucomicrobia bacterium]